MSHSRNRHRSALVAGVLFAMLALQPAAAGAQQGKGKGDDKSRAKNEQKNDKRSDKNEGRKEDDRNDDRQSRGPSKVPTGQMPGAGQCRVWVEGTPPGQQATPSDCATAMQRARDIPGARVLVGRGAGVRKGGNVSCANQRYSYPTYAPLMSWGPASLTGPRARELRQWNLPANAVAAANDFNKDGRPETVIWSVGGQPVQIWHNPDGDGSADIVEIFCNGAEVQQFVY